jgi:putative ABC transport system permease protein
MYILWLGFRNALRNRRRSILIVGALVISYSVLVFGIGWVRGYFSTIFTNINDFDTGHLQIYHPDYLKDKPRIPLEYAIQDYYNIQSKLAGIDGIKEVSGRIDIPARLSSGGKQLYAMIRAIDPAHESGITRIKERVIEGNYIDKTPGLILGKGLATKLGVGPGAFVIVSVRNRYRFDDILPVQVQGIFEFGYPAMDDSMAFMDLQTMQNLAALKDAVINVVIKIDNRTTLDALIRHINAKLAATPYRAYPWNHFAREMVQAVQADSGSYILFAIILLILSGANIVNVFSMSVQERTRELATLKAIGQKRKNLIWMILSEAMIQALIATVAGIAISAGFVWYISHVGIDIASYLPEDIPMPFGNRFYGDYRLYDFAYAGCFVILVSLLGAVIPARRAGRLVIADALREAR